VTPRLSGTVLDVPSQLSPTGSLTSVDIYISSQCNRRCTYCFLPPEYFSSGARMSVDRFSDILRWSRRQGVREVTLLGGEPSLHPSFADMVHLASGQGMDVRVVTNGARRFRRFLREGSLGPRQLTRVAVSLDSLDEVVQDEFRGPGAWRDVMATIELLRERDVIFDVNVTAVRPVLAGIDALVEFADQAGCRRVNIHWPSSMGIGRGLQAGQMPDRQAWTTLVDWVMARSERRPGFYVEIERGFLADGAPFSQCAVTDTSNLQILPDGRAYRCGLLVDQEEMASLAMINDQLTLTRPQQGEELLRATMPHSCDGCPVLQGDVRRACIYDKVRSSA
jgi:MoaA/NifB/PqqE/SkfB family radical SAM enzyme